LCEEENPKGKNKGDTWEEDHGIYPVISGKEKSRKREKFNEKGKKKGRGGPAIIEMTTGKK